MNEGALYELIGRLLVDLRVAAARNEQLQQQLAALQPKPEKPNAEGQ